MILDGNTIDIAALGANHVLVFYWSTIGTSTWHSEAVSGPIYSAPSMVLDGSTIDIAAMVRGEQQHRVFGSVALRPEPRSGWPIPRVSHSSRRLLHAVDGLQRQRGEGAVHGLDRSRLVDYSSTASVGHEPNESSEARTPRPRQAVIRRSAPIRDVTAEGWTTHSSVLTVVLPA